MKMCCKRIIKLRYAVLGGLGSMINKVAVEYNVKIEWGQEYSILA